MSEQVTSPSIPEQSPSRATHHNRLINLGKIAVATVISGGVGVFIGYEIGQQSSLSPANRDTSGDNLNYELEYSQVLSSLETHPFSAKLLADYLAIKPTYVLLPGMKLTADGLRLGSVPELTRALTVEAHKYVIDGIYLAKISLPPDEASGINYDASKDSVTFLNRTFNLKDPFQFQLFSAILEPKLQNQLNNSPIASFSEQSIPQNLADRYNQQVNYETIEKNKAQNAKNDRDIQTLLWLYDLLNAPNAPHITMEKDTFLLLPSRELVSCSQMLQALQKANLPFPHELSYARSEPGVDYMGWYADGKSVVFNNSRGDTPTHEIFHFLADVYKFDPENPRLREISQNAFDARIMGILGDSDLAKYISARDETGQPSLVEEYAQRGTDYKDRGDSFRSRISSLEKGPDPIAYQVAKAEYDFFKQLFNGQEFTDEGEVIGNTEQQDHTYKIGTRVAISDKDIADLGILLRKNPTDALDPSSPVVYNGAEVEILEEEPTEVTDLYLNKTKFYKVRVIWVGSKGDTAGLDNFNQTGWISKGYLGDKLPLPSIP